MADIYKKQKTGQIPVFIISAAARRVLPLSSLPRLLGNFFFWQTLLLPTSQQVLVGLHC